MISSTKFNRRGKGNDNPALSLTSLMDIFTILVFFLLLNSGESSELEKMNIVNLPDSIKGESPHDELVIMVDKDELYIEDTKIADIADILKGSEDILIPLENALKSHTEKLGDLTPFQKEKGLAVVILGDKEVPYVLLKSIMATCRKNNYRNVSLAVNRLDGTGTVYPSGAEGPAGPVVGAATGAGG